jgi:hypothetical protein
VIWPQGRPGADTARESCLSCGHAGRHASWCGDDYLGRERVEILEPIGAISERVLAKSTVGAVRAGRDLEAARQWKPKVLCAQKLSAADREWVHDRIVALTAGRQSRGDTHRERIRSTASWLGHQVRAHKVTLADADARIDRLLVALDPETNIPVLLVPFKEAKELATDSFEATFKGQAHE